MRKFISYLFLALPFICSADNNETIFKYYLWNDAISITGIENKECTIIEFPDSLFVENHIYPVKSIGIYDTCTVKKIIISPTITEIGQDAFEECNELEEVVIKDATEDLLFKSVPFKGCPIKKLTIGRHLTVNYNVEIPSSGMYSDLDSLVFTERVGTYSSIMGFEHPRHLYILDSDTPMICMSRLSADTIYCGRNIIGDGKTISGGFGYFKSLWYGPKVTEISYYQFRSRVSSLTIPSNIKRLCRSAFDGSSINKLVIEKGAEPLYLESYDAFYRTEIDTLCLGREIIYEDNSYGAFSGRTFMFRRNDCLKYIYCEEGVNNFTYAEFSDCSNLSYVRLSSTKETIEPLLFDSSGNILTLEMPATLKKIGSSAFYASKFEKLDLSHTSIDTIDYSAFYLSSIQEIKLPQSIKYIGNNAFYGCRDVVAFYVYNETVPTIEENTFSKFPLATCILYVPKSSVGDYKNDRYWGEFTTIRAIETSSSIMNFKDTTVPLQPINLSGIVGGVNGNYYYDSTNRKIIMIKKGI